jgi:hypothetical protein
MTIDITRVKVQLGISATQPPLLQSPFPTSIRSKPWVQKRAGNHTPLTPHARAETGVVSFT